MSCELILNHRPVFDVMLPPSSSSGRQAVEEYYVTVGCERNWVKSTATPHKFNENSAGEAPQGRVEVSQTQI